MTPLVLQHWMANLGRVALMTPMSRARGESERAALALG